MFIGWTDWRDFIIKMKTKESKYFTSFCLEPLNESFELLPPLVPRQVCAPHCMKKSHGLFWLTADAISITQYKIDVPTLGHRQGRQYSISDAPWPDYYRVSIKREVWAQSVESRCGRSFQGWSQIWCMKNEERRRDCPCFTSDAELSSMPRRLTMRRQLCYNQLESAWLSSCQFWTRWLLCIRSDQYPRSQMSEPSRNISMQKYDNVKVVLFNMNKQIETCRESVFILRAESILRRWKRGLIYSPLIRKANTMSAVLQGLWWTWNMLSVSVKSIPARIHMVKFGTRGVLTKV